MIIIFKNMYMNIYVLSLLSRMPVSTENNEITVGEDAATRLEFK